MTSDLSSFAARWRDFISRCADDPAPARDETAPAKHDSLEAEFNDLALALFALQFKHNQAYRKFCEARKSFPGSLGHWPQIPAIPTSAFKELELTCLPAGQRTTIFHSSGTTEQRPSRHFHSVESLAIYEASLWPWFRAHLLSDLRFTTPKFFACSRSSGVYDLRLTGQSVEPREKSAIGYRLLAMCLTPPPAEAPHSSLVHMLETVRSSAFRRSGVSLPPEGGTPNDVFAGEVSNDGAWALNVDKALAALRQSVQAQCPIILLGTAFSFVHLLDSLELLKLSFDLPSGSRVMETGGYKGRSRSLSKPELHSLITKRLGIPADQIVSEYGVSELSSQAYDREVRGARYQVPAPLRASGGADRVFHFPPWVRTQIISPESGKEVAEGETGLLRVFDLANVFSVMAIQTEDLAIRRGNGFELIGRAATAEPRGCSLASLAIADSQSPIAKS